MERIISRVPIQHTQALKLTKVAGYARVSSDKDAMLHSLAAQVDYYQKLILGNPEWMYAGMYADEALTGTKGNRPAFQKMLSDCREGKIDRIITKSISRFARNTLDLLDAVRELRAMDVDVYFEEQNIHTTDGDGELLLTILSSFAQEESLSASENQKWRIQKNYREGKPVTTIWIYGYRCHKEIYTIVPEEAEVVWMIFADYLSGLGKNAIMRKLTALNIPTRTGGRWTETSVMQMLRNEKYAGHLLLQKVFITDHITKQTKPNRGEMPKFLVKNHHEAIIDEATFETVQREIAVRASLKNGNQQQSTSVFSGMIRCQRCGRFFHRKVANGGSKYAKQSWACPTYVSQGKKFCDAKRIPEDILIVQCCEVLGLAAFDEDAFRKTVTEILVSSDGQLLFKLRDGIERQTVWQHPSRSERWTAEMKAEARVAARKRNAHA
jgi:DNA invertase Pin-like site-specific DNA recombinase